MAHSKTARVVAIDQMKATLEFDTGSTQVEYPLFMLRPSGHDVINGTPKDFVYIEPQFTYLQTSLDQDGDANNIYAQRKIGLSCVEMGTCRLVNGIQYTSRP